MTENLFYPYDVVKVKKKKDGKNNSKKNKKEEDKNELYGTVARVWHHEFETLPIESLGILDQSGVGRALVKGEYGVEVVPIKERMIIDGTCLELLNRDFDFGDLCKMGTISNTGSSSVTEGMTGIVTNVETELELRHVITDELIGKKIPADKVRPAEYVSVGDFVLYKNWVGIVKDKFDEVLCETDEMKGLIRYGTPSSIGAFRYGYTEHGGEEPIDHGPAFGRFQHHPRFVEMCQTVVYVDWLASNGKLTPQQSAQNPMPKAIFTELDQLIVLKHSLKQRYELDNQVIFASQSAAEEYNFKPSHHVQRSHFGTHKAQCNVMRVTSIHSTITVLWPDGRTSKHPSINLIPNVLDIGEMELWKGCHVLYTSIDEKDRGAIVESVNLTERTAQVYLYNEEEQTKGKASTQNDPTTVSTFEIKTTSSLKTGPGRTLRRGTVVMLVDSVQAYPPPITNVIGISSYADEEWGEHINQAGMSVMAKMGGEMMSTKKQGELNVQKKPRTAADAHEIDWFGIVIDMQTGGTIIVQLPAGRKVSVTMDKLSILINYSDDDDSDDDDLPHDEDEDGDDDSIMMDFLREAANIPWTTEDGSAVETANADEWEDDYEMDDDDADDDEVDMKAEKKTDVKDEALLDLKHTAAHIESSNDGHKSTVPVFEILEQAPTDHFFKKNLPDSGSHSKKFLSHLRKEYGILQSSLPNTIFVKAYEDRADLLRVLIIGSKGTPYEDAPILIDFYLKPSYPLEPPRAHFHSWSDGHGRLSPNLYQEGMVCLSLLNTWTGEGSEKWHPNKSTLLQVFISIQALVLVAEPYFTEAGFELKERSDEVNTSSRQYSERAYVLARRSIWHALKYPILGLEKDVKMIYDYKKLQEIKLNMQKLINDKTHDGLTDSNEANSSWSDNVTFSKGGQISLEKILMELEKVNVSSE